eukprot:scaffold325156_cov24-Prasinocladus_malaysianus.AAC.1
MSLKCSMAEVRMMIEPLVGANSVPCGRQLRGHPAATQLCSLVAFPVNIIMPTGQPDTNPKTPGWDMLELGMGRIATIWYLTSYCGGKGWPLLSLGYAA